MSFSEKIKQFFGFSPPEQKITAHDFLLNGDDLTCEMLGYWQEYQLRDLAFNCCVNLIANAIANCEFKTFERGQPVKSDYYYLLNVEPNVNENSTAFWKKVIYKLYAKNEALVVPIPRGGNVELWLQTAGQSRSTSPHRKMYTARYRSGSSHTPAT